MINEDNEYVPPKQDKRSGGKVYQGMAQHLQAHVDRTFSAVVEFCCRGLKKPDANQCEDLREAIAAFYLASMEKGKPQ